VVEEAHEMDAAHNAVCDAGLVLTKIKAQERGVVDRLVIDLSCRTNGFSSSRQWMVLRHCKSKMHWRTLIIRRRNSKRYVEAGSSNLTPAGYCKNEMRF
jgi:uncharacterized protein CbrC (UPF0167 family)